MIASTQHLGKKIALFGLGGSGIATALSLKEGGADLICFDDNPASVISAAELGLNTQDLHELDFTKLDALVLAPGVPLTHPQPHWTAELANAAGVPIIGDIELFANERNAVDGEVPFIAITGTNGKSTTTALIAHVLKTAGKNVQMGGNIGVPVLSLDPIDRQNIYVVEVSSYQIDLAPSLNPTVGVVLNLAPDHLDRHGTMENYAAIKAQVPLKSELAILGIDDLFTDAIAKQCKDATIEAIALSTSSIEDGIFADENLLIEAADGTFNVLFDLNEAPALRGIHNAQNAGAAWAACSKVGLTPDEIIKGLKSFPGLEHRLEQLGHIGQTLFVNDSKGTNADAAGIALSSFENIFWIAGGLPKEGGVESLREHFPKIQKAYLVGEAAPQFAATLSDAVPFEISDTIELAVKNASKDAEKAGLENAVVLLSPACASFDQFSNFEVRGDHFKECVGKLDGFVKLGDQQGAKEV